MFTFKKNISTTFGKKTKMLSNQLMKFESELHKKKFLEQRDLPFSTLCYFDIGSIEEFSSAINNI